MIPTPQQGSEQGCSSGLAAKNLASLTEKGLCLTDMASLKVDPATVSEITCQRSGDIHKLDFTFEYMGFLFAAKAEGKAGQSFIRVHANLGHLPYSSESRNLRANIGAIILAANSALDGRMQLTREQRILLFNDVELDEPLTPEMFMMRTVRFLAKAKPFLDLIQPLTISPVGN